MNETAAPASRNRGRTRNPMRKDVTAAGRLVAEAEGPGAPVAQNGTFMGAFNAMSEENARLKAGNERLRTALDGIEMVLDSIQCEMDDGELRDRVLFAMREISAAVFRVRVCC